MLLSPVHSPRAEPAPYIHSLLHPYCASPQALLGFPAPPSLLPLHGACQLPRCKPQFPCSANAERPASKVTEEDHWTKHSELYREHMGALRNDLRIEIMTMVTPN